MPWTQVVLLVLSSAAVGALVSSLLTLLGSALERKARRQELLLTKAIDLAINKTQIAMTVAEKTGAKVTLYDNVGLAASYLKELESLLNTGDLTAQYLDKEKRSMDSIRGK